MHQLGTNKGVCSMTKNTFVSNRKSNEVLRWI